MYFSLYSKFPIDVPGVNVEKNMHNKSKCQQIINMYIIMITYIMQENTHMVNNTVAIKGRLYYEPQSFECSKDDCVYLFTVVCVCVCMHV